MGCSNLKRLAMQIALSFGGIIAMVATATLLNLIGIKPADSEETAHSRVKTRRR